jgi:hypothetical protein
VVTSFPTGANLVNGMLRQLSSTGLVYRYNASSTLIPNGTSVISATAGNWENVFDGFDSFVSNTSEDVNGANLNILDIIEPARVLPEYYPLDGSEGPSRVFWIKNETSAAIPQGTRIGFTVSINGQPASEEFESLLKVFFEGYVDTSTGLLDIFETDGLTPLEDLNVEKDYQFGRTDLVLPKPLLPGMAYRVKIFPQFNSYELKSVPTVGTVVSLIGFFFDEAGSYNDASALIGDAILASNAGFRRVYPSTGLSTFVDEGSGTVAGFFFNDIGSTTITGLADDTADQNIVINNNGSVYASTVSLESNERLRAIISTESGESSASVYSSTVTADASPDITFTATYPSTISSSYDDVISGSNKGIFNAEEVAIYIRKNSTEIRKFSGLAPTNTTSDEFTVSWADGTVVSSLPSTAFGLFSPGTPSSVSATPSGSDNYQVAISFVYTGNSITGISHKQSDGCLVEQVLSFFEMAAIIEELKFWKYPLEDYAELKAIDDIDLLENQTHLVKATSNTFEIWTWDSTNLSVSDDISFIRPTSIANDTLAGRWVKVSGGGDGSGGSDTPTNAASGDREDLTGNITLTVDSPEIFSLDANGSDRDVTLYDGGTTTFRKHLFINRGAANSIDVLDETSTSISVVNPGEQLSVVWDTSSWIVI